MLVTQIQVGDYDRDLRWESTVVRMIEYLSIPIPDVAPALGGGAVVGLDDVAAGDQAHIGRQPRLGASPTMRPGRSGCRGWPVERMD
jgi:hypothetical protein